MSSDKATLHQMQTVLGVEDVYNILEVLAVDAHNRRLAEKQAQEDHR